VAEVGGAPAGGMPAAEGGVSATDGGTAATEGGAAATEGGAAATEGRPTIQDAILVIGEVRFLPCKAGDADALAAGPFLVDLVHGGTLPSIPEVSLPPGGFCGFDAPLAPAEAPSRLVGRSVYFGGTRADGTPFRFYANVQATLRVRARAGLTWGPGAKPSRTVFWALRPRQWLEPSELDALESTKLGDGSGAEAIDVERYPALLRAVRARLAGRSTLYDDVNADAAFDSADRDAVLGDGISDPD
jgi:hypothetical protein